MIPFKQIGDGKNPTTLFHAVIKGEIDIYSQVDISDPVII